MNIKHLEGAWHIRSTQQMAAMIPHLIILLLESKEDLPPAIAVGFQWSVPLGATLMDDAQSLRRHRCSHFHSQRPWSPQVPPELLNLDSRSPQGWPPLGEWC